MIYQAEEAPVDELSGEALEETLRDTKETAAGLDQGAPADLKLWSKEALGQLARLLNLIERSGRWLEQTQSARAAFLPKDEEDPLEPQSYRVLLMLPTVYRLWAKTRLRHLTPWDEDWKTDEMYAGVPGRGAADASYHTALIIENCSLKEEDFTGGAADIYKCFDQIDRTLLHKILKEACMPRRNTGSLPQLLRKPRGIQHSCRWNRSSIQATNEHPARRSSIDDGRSTAP